MKKNRQGNYKLPGGAFVRVCMTSDLFLEEADEWGEERRIRNGTDQMIEALGCNFHYPPVDIESEIQKIYDRKEMFKALRNKNIDK